MTNPVETLHSLISRLGLIPLGDGGTAYGAFGDTPVTLTVLSLEPLGLLFAFNVNRDSGDLPLPADFAAEWSPETCKVSVENGRAWLSLYDLTGHSEDEIAALLEHFYQSLVAAELAVGPGCVRCGCRDEAHVMHIEGRTTRICPKCLEQAIADKQDRDAELNGMSLSALLGLPTAILIAAGCWALFWSVVDLVIDWFRIRVIEINDFSFLLLLVLFVGTGAALGHPLGKMLRKSGAVRVAPGPLSCVVVLCAVLAGEVGYVALLILRTFGVLDLATAARWLVPMVANYSKFWIVLKVLCACAFGGFCATTASERTAASLKI